MKTLTPVSLPDFRNLGVIARTVMIAEALHFIVAYAAVGEVSGATLAWVLRGGFETSLLLVLLMLFLLAPLLQRRPYRQGVLAVLSLVATLVVLGQAGLNLLFQDRVMHDLLRATLLAVLLAAFILGYFHWRHLSLSPSLAEARLIALQARIRPHFLFNSLNTVLGLIRNEPRRAELVLENLSELYRALLADARQLVPLSREIELARGYAEIEGIRLGDRLRLDWHCDPAADPVLVPPMLLQPLMENAIRHGVETAPAGGTVAVHTEIRGGQCIVTVRNACPTPYADPTGQQVVLDNLRERLDLHFDAEARLQVQHDQQECLVQISLPRGGRRDP